MASSERRWAADVRAADSAFSVPRKSAKCLRICASSNAPSCLTISVELEEHGYVLVEGGFENGFYRGQDADPRLIAKALKDQGIEPERPPYTVSEGGSRLCFVRDPDGYRMELIERT